MKLTILQVIAGLIVVTALVLGSGIAEHEAEPKADEPMKYWRGMPNASKEGHCGTMAENGYVPDSIEITKVEYDQYVADQPVIIPVYEIVKYKDVDTGKILRLQKVHEESP